MAWITPTIAGISALAGLASTAMSAGRDNTTYPQQVQAITNQAGVNAAANLDQQKLIQALINQRSIAGVKDSSGGSVEYDPTTNQWTSTLGPLQQQSDDAAARAGISRNTTDLRQAQFANEDAANRATAYGGVADTARRNLQTFRPMASDQLVGLLQQQATNASNATFRPEVADTLRSMARTGTAAGPVLAQIGKASAGNLRDSLIDAQIKGMTGVDQINQNKQSGLETTAATTSQLANPAFQYSNITPSSYGSTMANLVAQRSNQATTAPAYGSGAVNNAAKIQDDASAHSAAAVPDPNANLAGNQEFLKQIQTATGKGGGVTDFANALGNYFKPASTTKAPTIDANNGFTDAQAKSLGDWWSSIQSDTF